MLFIGSLESELCLVNLFLFRFVNELFCFGDVLLERLFVIEDVFVLLILLEIVIFCVFVDLISLFFEFFFIEFFSFFN